MAKQLPLAKEAKAMAYANTQEGKWNATVDDAFLQRLKDLATERTLDAVDQAKNQAGLSVDNDFGGEWPSHATREAFMVWLEMHGYRVSGRNDSEYGPFAFGHCSWSWRA